MKWLVYSNALLPLIVLIGTTAVAPSFIIPFLHHWLGLVFLVLMVAWTASGLFYFARPETPLIARLLWAPFGMFLIFSLLLAPALITIVSAVGPIMTDK